MRSKKHAETCYRGCAMRDNAANVDHRRHCSPRWVLTGESAAADPWPRGPAPGGSAPRSRSRPLPTGPDAYCRTAHPRHPDAGP
jgi:hypothetical protein